MSIQLVWTQPKYHTDQQINQFIPRRADLMQNIDENQICDVIYFGTNQEQKLSFPNAICSKPHPNQTSKIHLSTCSKQSSFHSIEKSRACAIVISNSTNNNQFGIPIQIKSNCNILTVKPDSIPIRGPIEILYFLPQIEAVKY